jgi:hypothetical protein
LSSARYVAETFNPANGPGFPKRRGAGRKM